MLLAGLLAVAVRVPHVFTDALWQDEVASARILREPSLPAMLGRVVRTESTPPLWYSLAWAAHQAGAPIVDVRLLSALFGGLLAAAVVAGARAVLPLRFAAVAGVLVAVGAQFAWHGHELRAYELLALLTTLFGLNLARTAHRPTRLNTLSLGGVVAAGLLTHYFFVFSVATALLWLWLEPAARRSRARATVAIAVGAALCSPWLPYFARQYRQDRFWWIGPFDLQEVLSTPFRLFTPLVTHGASARTVPLVFLALVAAGALRLARISATGRLFAVLALGPLVVAGGAWAAGERTFAVRNLIEIGPFVAIAVVAALSLLGARLAAAGLLAAAAAAVVAFSITQAVPAPPYDRLAADLVREGWTPHDPVAILGDVFAFRSPLEWYLPDQPVLAISRPTSRRCPTLFAIGKEPASRGFDDMRSQRRTDGYLVARLAPDGPADGASLRGVTLRGATILADPHERFACVRPIDTGRLAPLT